MEPDPPPSTRRTDAAIAPPAKKDLRDGASEEDVGTALELIRDLDRAGALNPYGMANRLVFTSGFPWWGLSAVLTFAVLGGSMSLRGLATGTGGLFELWFAGLALLWVAAVPVLSMRVGVRQLAGRSVSLPRVLIEESGRVLQACGLAVLYFGGAFWSVTRLAPLLMAVDGVPYLFLATLLLGCPLGLWVWGHVLGELAVSERGALASALRGVTRALTGLLAPRRAAESWGSGLGMLFLGGGLGVFVLLPSLSSLVRWLGSSLGLGWAMANLVAEAAVGIAGFVLVSWLSAAWGFRYLKEEARRELLE